MLTMTVMQHEREAVGGFSKEVVEDKGDVLSSLRHLHRTLQECHWRVQSVDHALCTQGNNKSLDHLQNQNGNDHSFQFPVGKDHSLQNQPGESHNLQLQNETVKEYSLKNEAGKNDNFQNEAGKKQNLEDQSREIIEQNKDNDAQDNPEDHNHQNEIKEELKPENLSRQDTFHKELPQEKKSQQDIKHEDESFPLQDEGNNLLDLFSDSKENLPTQPTKDIDLQKASKECTVLPYSRPDHHIHTQGKKETTLMNNTQSTCDLDYTVSPHKQQLRGSIRQGMLDGDLATVDYIGATMELQHNYTDLSVSKTCSVPYITTDDIHHQLVDQHLKCSDKVAKEVNTENCSQSSEIRCRADHREKSSKNEFFHEREIDLFKNQKTSDSAFEDQKKDKVIDGKRNLGKVALVDTFPDVTQKMDIIWEALEKLRSHFLALHSSIVDSSSHCLYQELDKSLDKSDFTLLRANKVAEPTDLAEEHHARCEDEAGMLHQTTGEATQPCQSFCKQSSHKETLSRKLSQPACHALSKNCTRSCTFQHPVNEALASDSTACRGILFRGWREGCLCIGLVLLLLLLLLFLASCLLLMLPIVSVSVRNAGGLPAF